MKPIVRVLPVAIAFSIVFGGVESALAQDSVAPPNPLQGLFTPQPQYPTPQSPPNPQPFVPGGSESNPIKNLFNVQPQYPNSQTQPFATPEGPPGTTNHLQGFFTGQNPFQTPQTPVNPQATPHALSPEFVKQAGDKGTPLTDSEKELIKHLSPEAQAAVAAAEEKEKAAASPTGSGEKTDKDKTAAEKDKDEKDKTAEKDKDGKDKDKDKTAEKDKDGKDKDKKDGEKAEGDKDKKDGEKAEGDKDKKDGEKAEGDKDKDKEKTAKEEPPKVGPYNALTEATFHLSAGDPQRCHSLVTKIISSNPKHAQALYVRAVANVTMRKYPEAVADYRAVAALVPGTELARLAQEGLRKLHY